MLAGAALGLVALLAVTREDGTGEPGEVARARLDGPLAERRVDVDLGRQQLTAYEGEQEMWTFPISSGRDDRTPRGIFRIWKKHRIKDMKVGLVVLGKYYVLRNVPYIMYYWSEDVQRTRGFAIHGTYWHEEFGRPVSHGCINMAVADARKLFHWAGPDIGDGDSGIESEDNRGTVVSVHGRPPQGRVPR